MSRWETRFVKSHHDYSMHRRSHQSVVVSLPSWSGSHLPRQARVVLLKKLSTTDVDVIKIYNVCYVSATQYSPAKRNVTLVSECVDLYNALSLRTPIPNALDVLVSRSVFCAACGIPDKIRERVPGHRASNWERATAVSVEPEMRYGK